MNLRHSVVRFLLATFAVAATVATSDAALVTFGAPTDIVGDADVSTNGTLVTALNIGGPFTTVNGVNFSAIPGGTATGSAAPPFSNLSASYQSLLGTAFSGGGTLPITFNALTIGLNYEFQGWVNDSRNQTPPGFTFKVDVESGATVTLDPNPSLAEGGLGQYVIGTFQADSTSQTFNFTNSEVYVVNAVQLRQIAPAAVPEPGTALGGVLAMGLCGMLRRRRAA